METATEGVSLIEPDGTFSYVNSAFAQLFGYAREELLDAHWTVLYHEAEADRLENQLLPAVQETGYWTGETVRLTKDGDRLVTDHRLTHTAEGVIICTAQDLTDRRSESSGGSTTFEIMADAIAEHVFYTLDHEGYITRWTDGAKRLHGYETDVILGKHLSQLVPESDRQQAVPEQLLSTARNAGAVAEEGWRLRKDGGRFWAAAKISASDDKGQTIRGFGTMVREAPASTDSS